jgi:hypothetical protein
MTKKLSYSQIKSLQKSYGVIKTQNMINDGSIWKFEGSMGRFAMECLESGICMLPKVKTFDYYGNLLPPRQILKKGTKGTFQNSVTFWSKVLDYDEQYIEYLEETFCQTN